MMVLETEILGGMNMKVRELMTNHVIRIGAEEPVEVAAPIAAAAHPKPTIIFNETEVGQFTLF